MNGVIILIGLLVCGVGFMLGASVFEQQQKTSKDTWGLSEYLPESQSQNDMKGLSAGLMVFGGIVFVLGLIVGGGKKKEVVYVQQNNDSSLRKGYCVSCGNSINYNDSFCKNCGTRII